MKQKNQMALLAALVVIMAVVWYLNRSKPAVVAGNATAFQNYQLLAVENPQLHREKMEAAQKTEYHSLGRNPFSEIAPPPPETQQEKVATHQNYGPVLPPSPASTDASGQHEIFWLRHGAERNFAPRIFVGWR